MDSLFLLHYLLLKASEAGLSKFKYPLLYSLNAII